MRKKQTYEDRQEFMDNIVCDDLPPAIIKRDGVDDNYKEAPDEPRFERINRFHEYVSILLLRRGISVNWLTEQLSEICNRRLTRTFIWDFSNRPTRQGRRRESLITEMAGILQEPISKLVFLSGQNPWANRLELKDQWALWEFCERLVRAKEDGSGKPPATYYLNLLNKVFGGVELIEKMTDEEMVEYLRGDSGE